MSAAEWIAKRRELLDAATEGPWEWTIDLDSLLAGLEGDGVVIDPPWTPLRAGVPNVKPSDAALIADARTSLPRALDALEAVLDLARQWDGSPDLLPVSLRPYTRSERLRAAIEAALRADA